MDQPEDQRPQGSSLEWSMPETRKSFNPPHFGVRATCRRFGTARRAAINRATLFAKESSGTLGSALADTPRGQKACDLSDAFQIPARLSNEFRSGMLPHP